MKTYSLIIVCFVLLSAVASDKDTAFPVPENDKIGFVFELIRHGARAPLIDNGDAFTIPTGNLTQEGMRQRYLMGQVVRQKYMEDYDFLDEEYLLSQLYIQTSLVYRVIQSTYSQLIGYFPPQTSSQLLSDGEVQSLQSGKGMPPLKIRMDEKLNEKLGRNAIIDGVSQYPVFTYSTPSIDDDIRFDGCTYVDQCYSYTVNQEETFEEYYSYIYPVLKEPLKQAFDLSQEEADNLSYLDLYDYCDILVSEDFQGVEPRYEFSTEEWFYVRNVQKWKLIKSLADDCAHIYNTKIMRTPVLRMKEKVDEILARKQDKNSLRYMIYSAHDTQVANILEFFNFDNLEYYYVPYAAQIYYEIHYEEKCLDEVGDTSCFTIQIRSNGWPMKYEGCVEADNAQEGPYSFPYKCSFDSFLAYYDKISVHDDVTELCNREYVPQ